MYRMNKSLLFLMLVICSVESFAQENNFYVSNTFFDGQKVLFFSENRGGAVVILEGNRIHLMNRNSEFTDVTELFTEEIRNDITCIESVNENMFLIGTKSYSLLKYENGVVSNLKDINPKLPSQINSIDFTGTTYDQQLLVATTENIWISNDMKTFEKGNWPYTTNTKFFSNRYTILLTEYTSCSQIPGQLGLHYSYGSNTALFKLIENEGFNINNLNDIAFAKRDFGSGTYNTYAYYATESGIYAQHVYSCWKDTISHFKNTSVHDLELVSSGLTKSVLMAASDSGLLYMEAFWGDYFEVSSPQYFIIDGIDSAYTVDYSIYHNVIWVGTNNGLLQISDNKLVHESLVPETTLLDTINFCLEEGAYPRINMNDQLDRQWYRNGEKIEGALSMGVYTQEEGLYSVRYTYEGEEFEIDVAYVQLDSIFNERIRKQEHIICPTDRYALIYIDNFPFYKNNYKWYSVERGLEWDAGDSYDYYVAEEGGHYYFISTNCNGYSYRSDTVEVIKSSLDQPYFDSEFVQSSHCVGDTIYVHGTENAVNFSWRVDYDLVENHNEPYLVLTLDHFQEDLLVTTADEHGCELTARADLGYVLEPPFIRPDQLSKYICESAEVIYFDIPFGSTLDWEGYSEGEYHIVEPGTYPVTVSNGVCEDFHATVHVEYFDPLPELNKDSVLVLVNDTLKIYVDPSQPIYWNGPIQRSVDQSFLYATSTKEDTIQFEIYYPSPNCYQFYSLIVYFVEKLPLGVEDNISAVQIYPNPAKDGVRIETNQSNITSIQLLNLNGSIISSRNIENNNDFFYEFPPSLNNGIYIIQIIMSNKNSIMRRIIVNK